MTTKDLRGALQLPDEITQSELFATALTHRSASKRNNERLEYLGDAVLGLVIANALYSKNPRSDEGDLSRLRSHLVRKETLAKIANHHQLGKILSLGSGERKSGGSRRLSILADALEAVIGAVYLIKGFEFASEFVESLYVNEFSDVPSGTSLKDFKTRLQEHLQAQQMDLPQYQALEEHGEGDDKYFVVQCRVEALDLVSEGTGTSKRKAEQEAAKRMLKLVTSDIS